MKPYNKNKISFAKELRKNLTPWERVLWYDFLRNNPARFTRQKVFGKYILDFYSPKAKMVIEVDGTQHFETKGLQNDETRDDYLSSYGLKIIRIPNNYINNDFDAVCDLLNKEIELRLNEGDNPSTASGPPPFAQGRHNT